MAMNESEATAQQAPGTDVYEPEPDFNSIKGTYEPTSEDMEVFDHLDEIFDDPKRLADIGIEATPGYWAAVKAGPEVGTRETGENCQKYSRWFGPACAPWCAFFVSWCFDNSEAGNQDRQVPWPAGSTPGINDWARRTDNIVQPPPRTGDMILLPNGSHMGIVKGVNTNTGALYTIEGNYSDQVSRVHSRNFRNERYIFVRY
jgi:CHAP domain